MHPHPPLLSLPLPPHFLLCLCFSSPKTHQEPFGAQQFRGWCGVLGQGLLVPPGSGNQSSQAVSGWAAHRNWAPTGWDLKGASTPITSSGAVSPHLILGCGCCPLERTWSRGSL